jgi:hypothetical protein
VILYQRHQIFVIERLLSDAKITGAKRLDVTLLWSGEHNGFRPDGLLCKPRNFFTDFRLCGLICRGIPYDQVELVIRQLVHCGVNAGNRFHFDVGQLALKQRVRATFFLDDKYSNHGHSQYAKR